MEKILRIGLLGMGRIGKLHATNLQTRVPRAKIVMAADPFLNDASKGWAQELGIEKVTKDPEEVFTNPDVDAVFICSSTDTHAPFIIRAAQAGKDIFCEKPIDTDIERIGLVLEEVKKAGVKLQIGFVRRFDRSHKAVHDAAASGKLGRPYIIKVCSRDPEGPSMSYVAKSGGIFMDMMIHDFDMVRYLAGSEVTQVSAIGAVLTDPAYAKYGDVDTAIVTLKFADGAIGVIDNCRTAPYGYDQRVEVHCEKGCARDENHLNNEATISTADGTVDANPQWFFLERYNDAFAAEETQFVQAVLENKEVPVTGHDGLMAVKLAYAAQESLRSGRPVEIA